jgi:hypothetical protein
MDFTSFALLALMGFGGPGQSPPNDLCNSPIALAAGVNPAAPSGASGNTFFNTDATDSIFYPSESTCGDGIGMTRDVFFSYFASAAGPTSISTCTPSGFAAGTLDDSMIAVYDSATCPAGGASLACNDQDCGNLSTVTFTATAGVTYLVRVGTWGTTASAGTFHLTVTPPAPSNDEVSGAIPLELGVNPSPPSGQSGVTYSNVNATQSPSQQYGPLNHDVFFTYTPVRPGPVTFALCPPNGFVNASFDAFMVLYDAMGNVVGSGDEDCGSLPVINEQLTAGATYLLQVAGFGFADVGAFYVTVEAFDLVMDSPSGPGSLRIRNLRGDAGSVYYTSLTLTQGAFPNGWFFGVSPSFVEIYVQLFAGAPFVGILDGNGESTFSVGPGLPPLTLYGVTVAVDGFNLIKGVTPPVAFTL